MSSTPIRIARFTDKSVVDASLLFDVDPLTLIEVERLWGPSRLDGAERLHREGNSNIVPEHHHWNWGMKGQMLQWPSCRCLGVEADGQMQGLMMVESARHHSRLPRSRGESLLFIEFIESAPWNLLAYVTEPRYSGVGTVLIHAAIQSSVDLGYNGRIGLHALPQVESYYQEKYGMIYVEHDENHHSLPYYELTQARAEQLLQSSR